MAGKNKCGGCGETFGSLGAFDMHRVGSYGGPIYKKSSTGKSDIVVGHTKPDRRCLTIAEIEALGMTKNAKGWWIANAFSDDAKARLNDEEEDTEQEEDEQEEA